MGPDELLQGMDDVDEVWDVLVRARANADDDLRRAAERRMRELATTRRFAHLTDDELAARIRGISGEQETEGVLSYSPGGGAGGDSLGTADLMRFNQAIRANQQHGVARTLAALLAERDRRRDG